MNIRTALGLLTFATFVLILSGNKVFAAPFPWMCSPGCKSNETCEYDSSKGFHCVCYGQTCNGSGGGGPQQCPAGMTVSWANPTYFCGRAGNYTWHRSVGCCSLTYPNRICGDWYSCPTRNNPNKQCRDCEEQEPFCYPYNARVQVGSCVPMTAGTTGYVWEDLSGDGAPGTGDKFWGVTSSGQCQDVSSVLNVRLVGAAGTDAATTWQCTAGTPRRPIYTTAAYANASSRQFVLTPPSTASCSNVTWEYTVCENSSCSAKHTGSGSGCTATIANYTGVYTNTLNWRIGANAARTISGSVYQITDENTCAKTGELGLSGLSAQAYNDSTAVGTSASISSSDGTYSLTGLTSASTFNSVCISGTLSSGSTAYSLACVTGSGVTCQTGSGACAVSCTPSSALSSGDATVSLGFLPLSNDKWFSILDGDLYAESASAYVASSPAGGFDSFIINTEADGNVGGYGFASNTFDTQVSGTDVAEEGGVAERLSVLPNYPFEDEWLNKFSFEAPTDAQTSIPSSNDFEGGTVYSVSVSDFNDVLDRGSYSVNGDSPSAAIVYVTGSGTIDIPDNFTSDNDDNTLLVVTAAEVNISEDAGTTTGSYSVTGGSQIDLVIISQSDISLASQYNASSSTFDNPLMIHGGLMSNGTLSLDRNLGAADNSLYPATTVRFYPFLLNLIQQYEIDGIHTGLATVDVQFDYGE